MQHSVTNLLQTEGSYLISKVDQYLQSENNFKDLFQKHSFEQHKYQGVWSSIRKQMNEPMSYFDTKHIMHRAKELSSLIDGLRSKESQMQKVALEIDKQNIEFEVLIHRFQDAVLREKQRVGKALANISQSTRECLMQTVQMLAQITTSHFQEFKARRGETLAIRTEVSQEQVMQCLPRQRIVNIQVSSLIVQKTNLFTSTIDQIFAVLNLFINWLNQVQDIRIKGYKEILAQSNAYFQTESPSKEMIVLIELFGELSTKFSILSINLEPFISDLQRLKQNVVKHSQIVQSLLRHPIPKTKETLQQQLKGLTQQTSVDFIEAVVKQVYTNVALTFSKLKSSIGAHFPKKRNPNVDNSMDLSHLPYLYEDTIKPSHAEQHLWRQWRLQPPYSIKVLNYADSDQVLAQIKALTVGDAKQKIEEFSCTLDNKKKGILYITSTHLIFQSPHKHLHIPLDKVQDIHLRVKLFQKQLVLQTECGQIAFSQIKDVSRAHFFIQSKLQSVPKKKQIKKSVILSAQQKAFIQQRLIRINSQLEPWQGYNEEAVIELPNVSIDQVYDAIYSDKTYKNTAYPYLLYLSKKNGALQLKSSLYNPPGPYFYTNASQTKAITFKECALFSQRQMNYEVKLPPIPFMPKTCTSTEDVRLYWISDEQLDYVTKVTNKGAPGTGSFYIKLRHCIKKKQTSVIITFYTLIVFFQNTPLKGIITSNYKDEMKKITALYQKQFKKEFEGQVIDKEKEENKSLKNSERDSRRDSVKTLKTKNTVLIWIILTILLLNLLLRIL